MAGLFLWVTVCLGALDFVSEGEKQLSLNNPDKALTYLEAALAQGNPDERLLLNLGLAYQRLGKVADAQKTFQQGADLGGAEKKTFLLNLGIARFLVQDWSGAVEAYTAALETEPTFADALLNRANARLSAGDLAAAADDYRAYQIAAPSNPQKEKIDQLLPLLDQAVLDAQALKLAEETRKKKEAEEQAAAAAAMAEAQRKADEEAKAKLEAEAAVAEAKRLAEEAAAEAERQKQEAILAKVRESLAGASGDSQALSTGPSGVKAEEGDFSLEQ